MNTYLDRLKQLEGENISPSTLDGDLTKLTEVSTIIRRTPDMELTKPPKAPFVSFGSTGMGHVEKFTSESANDEVIKADCITTLEADDTELKTLIVELCRISGHTEDAQAKMLAACRNLYPFQVSEQRDHFRRQVEMATAGKYWIVQTTH